MNWTEALTRALTAHTPEETLLVVPTEAAGKRILHACAEAGAILVGVQAATPLSLAKELCAEHGSSLQLLSGNEAQELLFTCLRDLQAQSENPFFRNPYACSRKTAALMYDVITELETNAAGKLSGGTRQQAVEEVRAAYREKKYALGRKDRTDLLRETVQYLESRNPFSGVHFVVPGSSLFDPLEKQLLKLAAGAQLTIVTLPEEAAPPKRAMFFAYNAEKTEPDAAGETQLSGDTSLSFYRCRGEETEQRFILRDILKHGRQAEDCAVICLDPDYPAGIRRAAALFQIPVTVAGGIPLTGSLLYETLLQLSRWADTQFDAEALRAMLQGLCLQVPEQNAFLRRLRARNIGWGEQRYRQQFLSCDAEEQQNGTAPSAELLQTWADFLEVLFAVAGRAGDPERQKQNLLKLLRTWARPRNTPEAEAYGIFERLLQEIQVLAPDETVLDRLLAMAETHCWQSENEAPGKLFAAVLSQADWAGLSRKHLYVCGMSRFCMQGSRTESPLLLDEEKAACGLRTMEDREQENRYRLGQLLRQHQGTVTFSYCDYDTEKMIELQPAPIFRELLQGKTALEISFVPEETLNLADRISRGEQFCLEMPALPEQAAAEQEPAEAVLRPEQSYRERLHTMTFSPTALEEALSCPLKFYLRRIAGLKPEILPEQTTDVWLTAAEFGTLCHAVLEHYYAEAQADLKAIFDAELEQLKTGRPTTTEAALQRDTLRAWNMVEQAVRWTGEQQHRVVSTEQRFGGSGEAEPFCLKIGSYTVPVTGSIDRVDRLPDGGYAILDYKTGSGGAYRDHGELKVQPYLYARAAEQLNPEIHVTESGYLFLRDGADYLPVSQTAEARQAKEQTISGILDWLQDEDRALTAAPAFQLGEDGSIQGPGTPEQRRSVLKQCARYCEFAELCQAETQISAAELEAMEHEEQEEQDGGDNA